MVETSSKLENYLNNFSFNGVHWTIANSLLCNFNRKKILELIFDGLEMISKLNFIVVSLQKRNDF